MNKHSTQVNMGEADAEVRLIGSLAEANQAATKEQVNATRRTSEGATVTLTTFVTK
jgi:hypothetical protein